MGKMQIALFVVDTPASQPASKAASQLDSQLRDRPACSRTMLSLHGFQKTTHVDSSSHGVIFADVIVNAIMFLNVARKIGHHQMAAPLNSPS